MSDHRAGAFAKAGDEFLDSLNRAFECGETSATAGFDDPPSKPVIFVVGAPRSGTTLMTQWLAACGDFFVPTNLLARLYRTPYLGGLLQTLLTDREHHYLDELHVAAVDGFRSVAGKTSGLLAPHEFFYFWRRFFPLDLARPLAADERERCDLAGFARALGLLERAGSKPLAMKAIIAQYDLDLVASAAPTAVFVHTDRDEVHNVDSLLAARRLVTGSEEGWFSVRPRGSELVADAPPLIQTAAQVAWTNDDLGAQLAKLPATRTIRVRHSEFCADLASVYRIVAEALLAGGHALPPYEGPSSFSEHVRTPEKAGEIEDALRYAREIRPVAP